MATKKELLAESQQAMANFIKLSGYLFNEDAPMDMNEIPEDNEFYETARDLADEMGIDWKKMSREESNRILINLLGEYYSYIKADEEYEPVLTISFKKKE